MVTLVHVLFVAATLGLARVVPQKKLRVQQQALLARVDNSTRSANAPSAVAPASFDSWYTSHSSGRGIWKWNNALAAYQRHFSCFVGRPIKVAEVGVQSGGSILMWQDVLGPLCYVYGIDINPATMRFNQAGRTTIALGDQGDVNMWKNFYATVTPTLDILVDDGGHESHQMLVTLQETFPHLSPGGFVAIEDIHGPEKYLPEFFTPAAYYLAEEAKKGTLDSVHVYPFVLIVQRVGGPVSWSGGKDGQTSGLRMLHQLDFTGKTVEVSDFPQIWEAIATDNNWGSHIVLRNAAWGSFLTGHSLESFFTHFKELHRGNWHDVPTGCEHTSAATCTNQVVNSEVQAKVTGIHIYKDRLVVEVPAAPVNIQAVRRGNEWIGYGL